MALLLAGGIWAGASAPTGRPVLLLLGGVAAVLVLRRPLLLVVVCGLLAQGLAQEASNGMHAEFGIDVDRELTLLTDPTPDDLDQRWRAEVAHEGRRWQLVVDADATTPEFVDALAGERVRVEGTTAGLGWASDWLRTRHVVGSISVDQIGEIREGSRVHRLANAIRRRLTDGAASLGPRRQALFAGFVLGDDRFQDPVDAASFQRAGLTHLLAVSGQNVAFVLALLGPALRRLRLGGRLVATLAVIGLFALITRFEPSVLRASVMAAMAVTASTMGREASSIRVLALTVATLVLFDPFLVASVGFRLSVAASAGILFLSGPIARRMPGPRPLALAISVTAAAQLGVAPLLLATFGPVPIASVPANLLAGPASGPLMMWGMSAGLVAGFVPALASVLHVPTGVFLTWVEWVAREVPERMPGGHGPVRLGVIVGLSGAAALSARAPGWTARALRSALAVGLCGAVLLPAAPPSAPVWDHTPTAGVTVWVASDGTTVAAVDGRARPERAVLALSELGIGTVDVLVGRSSHAGVQASLDAIVADRGARVVVARDLMSGETTGRVGCLDISLEPAAESVRVTVVHVEDRGCVPPTEIASPDAVGARASPL